MDIQRVLPRRGTDFSLQAMKVVVKMIAEHVIEYDMLGDPTAKVYIYIWVFPKIGVPQNGW